MYDIHKSEIENLLIVLRDHKLNIDNKIINKLSINNIMACYAKLFNYEMNHQTRTMQTHIKPDILSQIIDNGMTMNDVDNLEKITRDNQEKLSEFNITNLLKNDLFSAMRLLAIVPPEYHPPIIKPQKQQVEPEQQPKVAEIAAKSKKERFFERFKPVKLLWSSSLFTSAKRKLLASDKQTEIKQEVRHDPKMRK